MDKELALILRTLRQKTGISVDVYSSDFAFLYSGGERIPFVHSSSYTDGLQDKRQNVTLFRFRFRRENYFGVIRGSDEIARNYALFICEHIEGNSSFGDELSKRDFLRGIVFGECGGMQILKFMRRFSVPAVACYVLAVSCESGRVDEIIDFLDNYAMNGMDTAFSVSDSECAFVKLMTGGSESEFRSPLEFAEIFCNSVFEETGLRVRVGVGGTVKSLSEAAASYVQAESALKLGNEFNSAAPVHSYKEYMLYKILEELPPSKLAQYYNLLADGDARTVFADADMLSTAEEFLENNLNVSETARKLYMHRNTLTYRLDKIERATGLNIRNFSDAVTFRLTGLLFKMLS